jgi:uncharacterized protein YktB (UPF0637 family)
MQFTGFVAADFEVFEVPGLEARMEALKLQLRPKLEALGGYFAECLSNSLGRPVYPHVARHARRTVNPPNDSWVALGLDKRGYKKYPHFQIGLWQTHMFATFGLIYESPQRMQVAQALIHHADEVLAALPQDFVFIPDHMDPNIISRRDVDADRLTELANRLAHRRNGELMMGLNIAKGQAVSMTGETLLTTVASCFDILLPLFRLASEVEVVQ